MAIAQLDEIRKQIQNQIRVSTPEQRLYNPSPEFVEQKVNGLIYVLPPNGYGQHPWEEEGKTYNGVLVVKDQYGVSKEARIKARQKGIKSADIKPDALTATALNIVSHIVAKLQGRGVIWLTGDEAKDAKKKKEADATWQKFQYDTALTIINNYNNRTAAFHRIPQNAGKLPPAMNDREIDAQEVVDAWQDGRQSRFAYVCKHRDGYGTDSQEKFERHMRVAHPAIEAAEATPAIAPKRRGRPPKVQPEA